MKQLQSSRMKLGECRFNYYSSKECIWRTKVLAEDAELHLSIKRVENDSKHLKQYSSPVFYVWDRVEKRGHTQFG